MSEKPIIFSGDMVHSILDGRKTQTRRVVETPAWFRRFYTEGEGRWVQEPWAGAVTTGDVHDIAYGVDDGDDGHWHFLTAGDHGYEGPFHCPYGRPGDLLYVREKWLPDPDADADAWADEGLSYVEWSGCGASIRGVPMGLRNPANCIYAASWDGPELAWRPSIHMPKWAARLWLRVVDVRVERLQEISEDDVYAEGIQPRRFGTEWGDEYAMEEFMELWDSLNAKRGHGWDTNPWVWVITFERLE